MTAPILTFFNNKGGVGKTSLVYHLAWMFAKMGKTVVVADLDPQANLTAAFIDEDELETLWSKKEEEPTSIYQCVKPLSRLAPIKTPKTKEISDNLHLLAGDVFLSGFEDILSSEWNQSLSKEHVYRAKRILTAFYQVMTMAAKETQADIIMADIGPNLGAINRSVLLATDYVVIPLAADLFSLQGLKNLGPTLKKWRDEWEQRLTFWQDNLEEDDFIDLPTGKMRPLGYVCQQHGTRKSRPVKAYSRWLQQVPDLYRKNMEESLPPAGDVEKDPACLAMVKHYHSLAPMAQESRKPIFNLTQADGAFASHAVAAQAAGKDFREMAIKIAEKMGIPLDG